MAGGGTIALPGRLEDSSDVGIRGESKRRRGGEKWKSERRVDEKSMAMHSTKLLGQVEKKVPHQRWMLAWG
jgi:hypothetical protein